MIPSGGTEYYGVSCPSAQRLREQIIQIKGELLGYKAWTDPLVALLWLTLAGYVVNTPKKELSLPELDRLESMDYEQLSRVHEELVAKLKKEKSYWKSWHWRLNESGDARTAVNRSASALQRFFCVNIPDDIITRRPLGMNE